MSTMTFQGLRLDTDNDRVREKCGCQHQHSQPLPTSPNFGPKSRTLRGLRNLLTPSFLYPSTETTSRPNAGLAALDGLRGLACFAVVNQHYTSTFNSRIYHYGWGTAPEDKIFIQLPFIKLLWAGSAHVFTFFVLSGYVLSYKPIKQMRSQSPHLIKTLTSAIFRRGMRLFLPAFFMTLFVAIIAQMGIYKPAERAAELKLMDHLENIPPQHPTLTSMLTAVWNDIVTMTNITNWGYIQPSIHQHLWTIVIEFRVSMLLFLIHCMTARLRPLFRILIAGYCAFWFCNTLTPVGSQTALFFAGMILAELDISLASFREDNNPTNSPNTLPRYVAWDPMHRSLPHATTSSLTTQLLHLTDPTSPPWRIFTFTLFLLGGFFLSCPYNASEITPFYSTLVYYFNPEWYRALERSYFLWSLGALFLLFSASHSPDIRWLYTNPFSQYLGKISFALYLVHGPVLHAVEYGMLPGLAVLGEPLGGRETAMGMFVEWAVGMVVCMPVVFWAADVCWRVVDVGSVRLARWVEGCCEVRGGEGSPVRTKC